jgi:adenylate cyclase
LTTADVFRSAGTRLAAVGLLALACAAAVRVIAAPAISTADARLIDRIMEWRNHRQAAGPHDRIVHIDLDDRSAQVFLTGDAGRDEFAAVMRTMAGAGVSAQVYDFVFAGRSASGDERLADAARSSPHVYAGMVFGFEGRTLRKSAADGEAGEGAPPWAIAPAAANGDVPSAVSALLPFGGFARSVTGLGFLNVEPDPDGVFRTIPLVAKYDGQYYPSLALRSVTGLLGVSADRVAVEPGRAVTLRGAVFPDGRRSDVVIPVDNTGAMRVDFRYHWGGFRHYSMGELWRDSMDPTATASWRAALAGRIAVIAEVATMRNDVGPVPIDGSFQLAGLQSNAIANILAGHFLRSAPAWVEPGLALSAFFSIWFVALRAPRWLWVWGLAIIAGLGGAATFMFTSQGIMMPVTFAALTTAGCVLAAGAWRFIDAAREREFTRRAFEAYFPPAVVARLVTDRGRLSQGARKELTIIFSDIVGFTSRSAAMAPEDVQTFLNAYFSRMVDIVFEHGGTVDKFIGDGLMVFFNDPDDQPDHAARAVRCALAMQAAVRAMDAAVQIRVGVHSGPAIVGNMGGARRLSYTAVGSNVNLAQRLESAAPPGGVLISEETARRLPKDTPFVDAGEILVKGLSQPVRVFVAGPVAGSEAVAV